MDVGPEARRTNLYAFGCDSISKEWENAAILACSELIIGIGVGRTDRHTVIISKVAIQGVSALGNALFCVVVGIQTNRTVGYAAPRKIVCKIGWIAASLHTRMGQEVFVEGWVGWAVQHTLSSRVVSVLWVCAVRYACFCGILGKSTNWTEKHAFFADCIGIVASRTARDSSSRIDTCHSNVIFVGSTWAIRNTHPTGGFLVVWWHNCTVSNTVSGYWVGIFVRRTAQTALSWRTLCIKCRRASRNTHS